MIAQGIKCGGSIVEIEIESEFSRKSKENASLGNHHTLTSACCCL